jgi:hypothetical protein
MRCSHDGKTYVIEDRPGGCRILSASDPYIQMTDAGLSYFSPKPDPKIVLPLHDFAADQQREADWQQEKVTLDTHLASIMNGLTPNKKAAVKSKLPKCYDVDGQSE